MIVSRKLHTTSHPPPVADLARLAKRMEADAMQWRMLQAYLRQTGVIIERISQTSFVTFDSETAADEFAKFLRHAIKKIPENNNEGSRRRSPSLTELTR